ncbi:HpcH/HpaI aldolase family protein [Nocardia sp. CA-120079]|uniref:HpcH/HpaI aldolase family protein n=1 Tax=Nocardia sp. CA-120079 TaxID=3239974 RepID=UPI003D98AC26
MTASRSGLGGEGIALGAWLFLREPLAAISAANQGYDYVCVDMQHGLAGDSDIGDLLGPLAVGGAFPTVRVAGNDATVIGRVLDAGARAVIIPMVNTAAEARAAVEACYYAPTGKRSVGPLAAGTYYGRGYLGTANDDVWCIPMIETEEAVANIDEILAVPGVRAIYVGPADLSLSMNIGLDTTQDDPRLVQTLAHIAKSARRAGVLPGIHASAELARGRADMGYRMITVGYDWLPLVAGLDESLKAARDTAVPRR